MAPHMEFINPNAIKRYRRRLFLRSKEPVWVIDRGKTIVSKWERRQTAPRLDSVLAISATLGCYVKILFLEQF